MGFVLALVEAALAFLVVVVVDVEVLVVPVVAPVVLELFGFLSDPALGLGRLRLVLGAVFVLCCFSLGRVTRNAPRTSSWSSAAIEVMPTAETIAQAKRMTMYLIYFSYITAPPQVYCVES